MEAELKATTFQLPGEADLGSTVYLEVTAIVVTAKQGMIEVTPWGDQNEQWMLGEKTLALRSTHVRRLTHRSDGFDPQADMEGLHAEILKREVYIGKLQREIHGLKQQNPDNVYVPGLQQTIDHLTKEKES